MSNADRNESLSLSSGPGGSSGACVAESLKALIGHIAEQIADADQRHADMLRQMQMRLQSLGLETRAIRGRVPGEFAPAFERIEEGMQLLADSIAGAHAFSHRSQTDALGRADWAPEPAAFPGPPSAAVADLFDPSHAEAEGAGPWSRDQADALASLYHAIDGDNSAGMADSLDGDRAAADGHFLGVTPKVPAPDSEHAWLEARFAEIAQRIEQSLTEIRPESSFLALGRRFELFEARMGSVLEDVATRSDVEGLRLIEAHISELAQQLDATQLQLARLDGIEAQLSAVVGRLSDPALMATATAAGVGSLQLDDIVAQAADRVASQLAGPGAAGGADYQALAARAAEEAISRFVGDLRHPQPAAGAQSDELRSLVESFIRERREGDEQTAAVLDTLQQAMIRILDRMDAVEHSGPAAAPFEPLHEFARGPGRFAAEPRDSAFRGEPWPASDHAGRADGFAAPAPTGARPAADAAPFDPSPIGSMSSPQPSAGPGRPAKSSIDRLRQDFIADAQRAKLRAEEEATDPAKGAAPASAKPAKPGAAAAESRSRKSNAAAAGKAAPGGMPIKKILVAALGLVIVVQGANLLLARRKAEAPKPTAAQAIPVAPSITESAAPGGNAKAPAAARAAAAPQSQPSILDPSAGPAAASGAQASGEADNAAPSAKGPAAARPAGPARFVLPSVPDRPATVPETVVDQLNYLEQPLPRRDERVSVPADDDDSELPVGIAVQTSGRPPTPHDLARLQQQQQMATWSSKLGAAAARTTPAALLPDFPATPTGSISAAPGDKAAPQRSALELPPVTVGPLSLRLAAAKGDPSAEFEVGARLAEGKGTDQSFKEAVKWYTRSANQGFAQSQYRLGTLYERGLGVKADLGRARVWYGRAAEQGNVKAMHNLAVLNAGSKSSGPDYAAAAHWFGEAALRGLADSQFNLAVLYDAGLGVSQDAGLAYQWFSLAARSGDKEAVRRRDLARAGLQPAEAMAVDHRVASWLPQQVDPLANDARVAGEAWKSREGNDASG